VSGVSDRIGPPPAPAAATALAAAAIARRGADDARASDPAPEPEPGRRPDTGHSRYASGAPDPSGRTGSLIDVFA
jgi:hypothetical protein